MTGLEEGPVMGRQELIQEKRREIPAIAAKHGAYNVRLFGSVARGEAGPESDVDILVDAGPVCTPFFPGGLVMDLQNLLGRPLDVVTEKGLRISYPGAGSQGSGAFMRDERDAWKNQVFFKNNLEILLNHNKVFTFKDE